MSRIFILKARKAWSTEFNVNNLKSAGRMDLVSQVISSSLWISNAVRQDTIIHVVLEGPKNPPKILTFDGNKIQNLDFDEKSIAEIVNFALKKSSSLKFGEAKEVSPGISVEKNSFEYLIKTYQNFQLFYLHPKGEDVRKTNFNKDVCFVFGDYIGLPKKNELLLDSFKAEKLSLGPHMLFAAHCPIIVHNELDRREL